MMVSYPVSSNFSKYISSAIFSIVQYLVSSLIDDFMFTSFQQKNEIEKGKHPNGILIFTFWLESMNEFFDMRKYKFQKKLDRW